MYHFWDSFQLKLEDGPKTADRWWLQHIWFKYDGKDGGIWVTIKRLLKSKGKYGYRKIGILWTFWDEYPLVNQTSDEKIDEGSNWKWDFQESHPALSSWMLQPWKLTYNSTISATNFRPHCGGKQLDVHLLVLQAWCTFLPFWGPAPESLRQSHVVPLHDGSAHVLVASFRSLAPMAARVLCRVPQGVCLWDLDAQLFNTRTSRVPLPFGYPVNWPSFPSWRTCY